jgi:predicted transposase/invertase (TIGR01784 family)
MKRTIISFDYAIKTVFRDKANFDILSGFLTELLERNVEVLEVVDSEGNPSGPAGKTNRLDVKAKFDDGEIAVFEFQYDEMKDFLGKAVFNASKAVVEQVPKGSRVFDFKKVYSINISYYNMGAEKEYVFRGRLDELTGIHYNETMPFSQSLGANIPSRQIHPEYYLILPNMFGEQIKSKFDEWVYVLKTSTVKSEFTAAGIQQAGERLDTLKMTPEELAAYEAEQYATWRYNSTLHAAKENGKAEGLEKGEAIGLEKGKAEERAEANKSAIANALKAGYSIEIMTTITGLTQEQVMAIIKIIQEESQ